MSEMDSLRQGLQVSELDGGSVVTNLGYDTRLNSDSSLRRRWIVVNDPDCPAQLKDAGVKTSHSEREFLFTQSGKLRSFEGLSAFEVRYVLYDMFGRHLKTLSSVSVKDIPPAKIIELNEFGQWRGWENEVASLFSVVAFVAHVRTAEGRIWRHKERQLSDELARIELAATSEVLNPVREK